jgi:hypothetical protein
MSNYDNERTAAPTKDVQASPHELRSYALSLAIREHGHWRQSHPDDSSFRMLDRDRRKKNVTHNSALILRHQ